MKIYTKTGDKGSTSLYDGSRVSKDDIVIECVGDLDELNSEIGCVLALYNNCDYDLDDNAVLLTGFIDIIIRTQSYLFDLGSLIAYPKNPKLKKLSFDPEGEYVKELENAIDSMTSVLPELRNFILPGGNELIAFIHKTRTVCRRFERKLINLKNKQYYIEDSCLIYINRLSDFLFTFARYVCFVTDCKEVIYKRVRE